MTRGWTGKKFKILKKCTETGFSKGRNDLFYEDARPSKMTFAPHSGKF